MNILKMFFIEIRMDWINFHPNEDIKLSYIFLYNLKWIVLSRTLFPITPACSINLWNQDSLIRNYYKHLSNLAFLFSSGRKLISQESSINSKQLVYVLPLDIGLLVLYPFHITYIVEEKKKKRQASYL